MTKVSTRTTIIVGFMLFAMFFGAGNLIFPPALGLVSGEYFWITVFAFILTGVGLPILATIVGSLSKSGYKDLLKNIHPAYALVFMIVLYLVIGPLFAIPRTATVSYEMSVLPFLDGSSWVSLLLFSFFFFLVSLIIALYPGKITSSIGKYLTPILLTVIVIYIVGAFIAYWGNDYMVIDDLLEGDFFGYGFTEGYLTLDAIAAMAFSVIIITSLKKYGVTTQRELLTSTIKSGTVALILLGTIYISLAWIGNNVALDRTSFEEGTNLGTYVLTFVSNDVFGVFGTVLLGLVVLSACLTTSIGLIVAVSNYFNEIFPAVSYKVYVFLTTLVSFGLANQGLEQIINTSVPVLFFIYPLAISSILLLLLTFFVKSPKLSIQLSILFVFLLTVVTFVHRQGWVELSFVESIPFFSAQLEWVLFAVAGYLIGYFAGDKSNPVDFGEKEPLEEPTNS